jgi:hypothetical protein
MKIATYLRRTLAALITGATGSIIMLSGTAHAATSQSFQISPPTANYATNPGTSQKGTIKVTNLTDAPLSVRVGKQNFVAKGEEGEIELVDDAAPLYSLAPWFRFDAAQLDIPALGTKELHYTLDVPIGAEPGGRYGSVVFNTIPPKLPSGQSGASVQQQIAGIVFLRTNGKANEKLELLSFAPDKTFSEYGPVNLMARIKNTGNVHEKPVGTITIKNMFGLKVDTIPLAEHFVIPDAVRQFKHDWPAKKGKKHLLIGRYTAELDATYGDGQKITGSTTFTIVPWKILGAILIGLTLLFLVGWRGRKRLRRAVRILAGRE